MSLHVDRAGRGPDLVLLHGWGMHSGAWLEEMPELARRFTLHAIDLPGHGHSASVAPGSFEDAAELVGNHVPADAIICGWSLGGMLAQRLAVAHAAKVRALVLLASTPCFVSRPDWPHGMKPETLATFADGLARDRDDTLARFVQLNALHGSRSREAIRTFTTRLGERGAPTMKSLAATLEWLRDTDLRSQARFIAAPTVLIHGARDALAPVAAAQWLARHIPSAKLTELPDAAHIPFFTHREAFLRALEPFVG